MEPSCGMRWCEFDHAFANQNDPPHWQTLFHEVLGMQRLEARNRRVQGVKVLPHSLMGGFGIAFIEALDNGSMFFNNFAHVAFHWVCQMPDAVQMGFDTHDGVPHAFQFRGLGKTVVEQFVSRVETPEVAAPRKLLLQLYGLSCIGGGLLGPVLGSFLEDRQFKSHAGKVALADFLKNDG